jgi:hypothetical protein
VVVLFALAALVIFGSISLALDGGYGDLQHRRAQSAADFAGLAGTRALFPMCMQGKPEPTDSYIQSVVTDTLQANDSEIGSTWTAYYLDPLGHDYSPPVQLGSGGYPPYNACGVRVGANLKWRSFFAGLIGFPTLQTIGNASAVNAGIPGQTPAIVGLNAITPHQILGGGFGSFNVYGTIFANSSDPDGRWICSGSCGGHAEAPGIFVDIVDAKETSNLILNQTNPTDGIIYTVIPPAPGYYPLDWCFGGTGQPPGYVPPPGPFINPPGNPQYRPTCVVGTVQFDYWGIASKTQLTRDPVSGPGGLPDPLSNAVVNGLPGMQYGLCPQQAGYPTTAPHYTNIGQAQSPAGSGILQPGVYDFPVRLDGPTDWQLADCSGHLNLPGDTNAGTYRFPYGAEFAPTAGHSITGYNVMIATGDPWNDPLNEPGTYQVGTPGPSAQCPSGGTPRTPFGTESAAVVGVWCSQGGDYIPGSLGNGGPCVAHNNADVTSSVAEDMKKKGPGSPQDAAPCPNTPYWGVASDGQQYLTNPPPGNGSNFSFLTAGAGTIDLNPPTFGEYKGLMLFQTPQVGTNFGLNAYPGVTANVTLHGIVYNASLANFGASSAPPWAWYGRPPDSAGGTEPLNFWDDGIPWYSAGTLQVGAGTCFTGIGGTACGAGGPAAALGYPYPWSVGTVDLTGPSVVDQFNTDGYTTINIHAGNYPLPGTPQGQQLIG